MSFDTLEVSKEGAVLFADIAAPPMNLLGPELVRDLVSLIQRAEADNTIQVLVFKSADPDYFVSHVDVTKMREATVLTSGPSATPRRHSKDPHRPGRGLPIPGAAVLSRVAPEDRGL